MIGPNDITPLVRPSELSSALDALDGPRLARTCEELRQRLRDLELPLKTTSPQMNTARASLLHALANALAYYLPVFKRWPADVITDPSQRRVRREFRELARHVWVVLEPGG
jgi:hypothetical protein